MARQQPIELFMPPNMLKAKVGGTGGLDVAAIQRAEAAIDSLKDNFGDWLTSDIERLAECREKFVKTPDEAARKSLFGASIDIKGQATTFEFPLIARVAASLCKLIEQCKPSLLPHALIDAHIQTMRAFFRDQVKDAQNPTAVVLLEELERRTQEASGLSNN